MGVTNMVSNLARLFEIVRAAIIAGTAHARPPTNEIDDRPVSPTLLKNRSERYPNLAIYPECSRKAVKAKSIAI